MVLLRLPVVGPFASILKQPVAVWDEKLLQDISVLHRAISIIGLSSAPVCVFAGLLVSACHKDEVGDPPPGHTYVHMNTMAVLGFANAAFGHLCTPMPGRLASRAQFEDATVSDYDTPSTDKLCPQCLPGKLRPSLLPN